MRWAVPLSRGLVLALALVASATGAGAAASLGGTAIENIATATYGGVANAVYSTASNTVTTTVAAVGAIAVSPKAAKVDATVDGYGAGLAVTKTFTITNVSNIADAYTIETVAAGPAHVTAIAFVTPNGPVPVTLGATRSPVIPPGGSVTVTVAVSTTGITIGTSFAVAIGAKTTAAGTVNGLQSDTGTTYAVAMMPPTIVGPGGPGTRVSKMIGQNHAVSLMPGENVSYDITMTNSGVAPATGVVLTDVVPAGIHPNISTVKVNGVPSPSAATLAGQTVSVVLGTLAAGESKTVSIGMTIEATQPQGASYVNVATVSADGLPPAPTTAAGVLTGASNVVYDGIAGQTAPVTGAHVTLIDPQTQQPLALTSVGASPNVANANPFVTAGDGRYGFGLQIPRTAASRARASAVTAPSVYTSFVILIDAPGYVHRKIGATLTLDAQDDLYTVVLTSLDHQPLAKAGGFTLVTSDVRLDGVFDLLGNLPLFSTQPIGVTKTVDRPQATPGDRLMYTVTLTNSARSDLGATSIVDRFSPGLAYLPGSARLDGKPVTPQVNGQTLTIALDSLPAGAGHTLVYACVVLPSVAPQSRLSNVVDVSASVPNADLRSTGSASVDVLVTRGMFSPTGVITGRVFIDAAGTGRFNVGDSGVSGVRVVMEDGTSVVTDPQGRYSFAGVRPGTHVLALDPTTIPAGVRRFDDRRYDSSRSALRLVHGLLDSGLLQDINFALTGKPQ